MRVKSIKLFLVFLLAGCAIYEPHELPLPQEIQIVWDIRELDIYEYITPYLIPLEIEYFYDEPYEPPLSDDLYVQNIPVEVSLPMVALTFDDGPGRYTEAILDLLEAVGGKATFCVIGKQINYYPEAIIRMAAMGSEVIGHSWSHPILTNLSDDDIAAQIQNTSKLIYELTGTAPRIHRAPFGKTNRRVLDVSAKLGYSLLSWSIDTRDWQHQDPELIYRSIMDYVVCGSIIVLHDIHTATKEAMIRVIPRLVEKGFNLVTASELIAHHYGELEPGRLYIGIR